MSNHRPIIVATFYHFVQIDELEALRRDLQTLLTEHGIMGTVLLAREGINGTVAGSQSGIDSVREWLYADLRFRGAMYRESAAESPPFHRMKVKIKRAIVNMGVETLDPRTNRGTYVDPEDWNGLISDPDTLVIDARNDYEVRVGTFRGAVNPETRSFGELPAFLDAHLEDETPRRVAMFCTGGIRCEKSTAYLRDRGIDDVFHLRGGILNYLASIPPGESLWKGECFVFDERVSVDHTMSPGAYELCRACRSPLSPDDRADPLFVRGRSCPFCVDRKSDEDRQRYGERHRQIQLARSRGERHIGRIETSSES